MDQAYLLIILSSLAIGLIAGFVMHRADLRVTASFRDMFLFRGGGQEASLAREHHWRAQDDGQEDRPQDQPNDKDIVLGEFQLGTER